MIRCLVQREMMHEKGFIKKPFSRPLAATVIETEANQYMLDYRDISLMESVPLLWRTVTASPVGIEPMTILKAPPPLYLIHNVENSAFSTGWPPNTPYDCAEARKTQVADATFRDLLLYAHIICAHSTRLKYNLQYTYIIWHRIRPAKRRPV